MAFLAKLFGKKKDNTPDEEVLVEEGLTPEEEAAAEAAEASRPVYRKPEVPVEEEEPVHSRVKRDPIDRHRFEPDVDVAGAATEAEDDEEDTSTPVREARGIEDEDELYSIGFYDYENAVIACEWSENIPYALPKEYYSVTIVGSGDSERKIVIEKVRNE